MAEAKTSQRNPSRVGVNREQARRGGYVTPSANRPAGTSVAAAAGGRGRRGGGILDFIRETRSELRKVTWPSSRETTNLTVVVVALSISVGIVLGGVDFIFQELFRFLLSLSGSGGF